MDACRIADAADRLDEPVGRVEAGETVDLKREGRIVARSEPASNVAASSGHDGPVGLDDLRARRDSLPFAPTDAVARLRYQARYR